jgi:gluconolactonase
MFLLHLPRGLSRRQHRALRALADGAAAYYRFSGRGPRMADTDFEIIHRAFRPLIKSSAIVRRLFTGCAWAEGPVYIPAFRQLIWSDIPNDRMLRFDEQTETTGIFRQPAGYSNGNTTDRQGRLVSCQHGFRSVTRTAHDGTIETLASRIDGKRLNSPNDVVVRSDGSIWFSDPTYGIDSDYEGYKSTPEAGGSHLYVLDSDGVLRTAATDFVQPNGLAFSPDEKLLYVSDTGASHKDGGPRHMRRFTVEPGNRLSGGEIFAECTVGAFDGFRVDTDGRVWTSAGDGVHCYAPDGTLLGKILVPERVANVAFGGTKLNILYICATTSLYAVRLAVNGCRLV